MTDRILECYEGEVGSDRVVAEARERIDWLVSHIETGPVLDVGCSQGVLGILLARKGIASTGIDDDPEAIAVARERIRQEDDQVAGKAAFEIADARDYCSGDLSGFSTVVLSLFLDQIEESKDFLETLVKSLARDVRVIIQVTLGYRGDPESGAAWYPISLLEQLQPHFIVDSLELVGERLAAIVRPRPKDDVTSYEMNADFCRFIEQCMKSKDRLSASEIARLRNYVNKLKTERQWTIEGDKEVKAGNIDWKEIAIERRWALVNAKRRNDKLEEELEISREKLEAKQEFILRLQERLNSYRGVGDES